MTTLNLQVGASSDDVNRELGSDVFSLTSLLFAGDWSSSVYDYSDGTRFLNVTIGQGDTIDAASMQFRASTLYTAIPETNINGEDVDDAATFTTSANYDGRVRTAASVTWTPAAWTGGTWYTSAEIKVVIQGIIDRGSWASGNALVTFWYDATGWGGSRKLIEAKSYDSASADAPKLDIDYTAAPSGVTVTPPTLALILTTFVPTVTTTGNVLVTPPTLALSLTTFAPTVSVPVVATPPTLALVLSTFVPTITITENVVVTVPVAALSLTTFAPTVGVSDNQLVTPPKIALILTTFAPTVTATANVVVTPPTLDLVLATFAPTVAATANVLVTPTTLALVLTTFIPSIAVGGNPVTVTPPTLALILSTFIPVVSASTFTSKGAPFLYAAANWGGSPSFYLEAYFRAVTGTARARLYNETDGVAVAGSGLSTASTTKARQRSNALSLTDGKVYAVQFGTDDGSANGAFVSAKIIAI